MYAEDLHNDAALGDQAYQERILPGVSRTFALTIPQLPMELRAVVTNGYLLCRIADTIEDEPYLTAKQKGFLHAAFTAVVAGNASAQELAQTLTPLLSEYTLPAERELVKNTPRVIRVTHSFSTRQRAALERCVRIMCRGMARFQRNKSLDGLQGLSVLDSYCYHVAGVVGEMLTELFCDYSREIDQHRHELYGLAISFGQGLQMTNILKDIWDDRQRGACWLPQDVFEDYGFDLQALSPGHYQESFGAGLSHLIAIALTHLRQALAYTFLIPKREVGIRRFCLWAIGLAVLTLRKINKNRNFTTGRQVKVSRRTVKATILITRLAVAEDNVLRLLFDLYAKGLPIASRNEQRCEQHVKGSGNPP
jgi:Phytoene/squalene synthetase